VTVFGPSAEKANGFSTSLMILGKQAGLKLINEFREFSCVMITDDGKVFTSKNFDMSQYQPQ
jgi:thiamine biosynthesis lipoprotein